VIEAASGEEAIALIRSESPRLVVMDITLPGMNGIEATRQIKATLPSAQIVMLTIHEDDTHRADATGAGASAYVPKRAMQTELLPTLAALLANDHDGEEVRNNAFSQ
jgi:DNA-binding NarL/FixJ family response regulator